MPREGWLTVSPDIAAYFRRTLLRWYRRNARPFPWRATADPYHILVSEVLLQRTKAVQALRGYEKLTTAAPGPSMLAEASLQILEEMLQPLGLVGRAARLKKMGQELLSRFDGEIPSNVADLMELPGVGPYIARATACFATGARVAVLDANVVRIFSRFLGIASDSKRPSDDPAFWRLADTMLPRGRVVDYNRALIDFGALVCKPRVPKCSTCPLRRKCEVRHNTFAGVARSRLLGTP